MGSVPTPLRGRGHAPSFQPQDWSGDVCVPAVLSSIQGGPQLCTPGARESRGSHVPGAHPMPEPGAHAGAGGLSPWPRLWLWPPGKRQPAGPDSCSRPSPPPQGSHPPSIPPQPLGRQRGRRKRGSVSEVSALCPNSPHSCGYKLEAPETQFPLHRAAQRIHCSWGLWAGLWAGPRAAVLTPRLLPMALMDRNRAQDMPSWTVTFPSDMTSEARPPQGWPAGFLQPLDREGGSWGAHVPSWPQPAPAKLSDTCPQPHRGPWLGPPRVRIREGLTA